MDKKRTGILTLSSAQNYGAVLQSHSLCKYLNDNFTYTEIINFTPKFIVGRYPLVQLDRSSIFRFGKTIISSIINYPFKKKKNKRFIKFRKKDSIYGDKRLIGHMIGDDYDQYIVGSDQVFNLYLTGNDVEFFLPTIRDGGKKATYAASLGVSQLNDEQALILKKGLKSFKFLSFRENVGCKLVNELLPDKKIERMIDPVFLNDREYWMSLANIRKHKKPYIFIYAFANFEKAYTIAKSINRDIDILLINDSIKRAKPDVINARGVGPKEFLSLIIYAEYIITDSFHGTAFSMIFHKKFYAIPYKGTESRFVDMLELFNLKDRIIVEESTKVIVDKIKNDHIIDYNLVDQQIEKEKKRTNDYFIKIYGQS